MIQDEKKDNEQYSRNFTRIPNILFIAYPDLSKEEKYLYSDLRRVYWDMKPRFVTLRELSALTGYSIGALSKMLPHLHNANLVHAEVRREKGKNGREKGNPKYYITIVDIWEVNRLFFSCSQKKQVELAALPSAQLVHEIEQACSPNDTSLFTKKNKPDPFDELDCAQVERAKDITKDITKDRDTSVNASDTFTAEKDASALSHPPALFFHPQHSFLAFDDLIVPTKMVVYLVEEEYADMGEITDKGRYRVADEVRWNLEQHGITLQVTYTREKRSAVVEQLSTSAETVTQVMHTQGASNGAHPSVARDPGPHLSDSRQHSNSGPHLGRTSALVDRQSQVQDTRAASQEPLQHTTTQEVSAPDNVAEVHAPATTVGRIAPHAGGDTPSQQAGNNSYSPNGSTKPPAEEKKPKQSRRPPKSKIDAAMQQRIDHACTFFDQLAQEITGASDYHYTPSKKDIEAIVEWLNSNPTEEILREVYTEMWNTPIDVKTGFDWKKNMYIHSVLKQYSIRALSIKAKLAKRKQDEARKIVQHMSVLPPMPEEPELPCVFKSNAKHLRKVMG